jgi:thiol-disulfide isomerase/thioredoxin
MVRFLFLFIVIVMSLCGTGQGASRAALPEALQQVNFNLYPVPCPANDMILRDLQGGGVSLSGLRNKVVILNFWKIDCPPCSKEKPILEKLFRKYSAQGLAIVAVNLFDERERQVSYVRDGKYSFTFAFDPDHLFSIRSQNLASGSSTNFVVNYRAEAIYEVPGVPTTYVIDRSGRVIGNSVGMVNWEKGDLTALLESLLAEPPVQVASAQNSRPFEGQARQGADSTAPVKRGGPAGPVGHRGPTAGAGPQAPEDVSPPTGPAQRLPFQGSSGTAPTPTTTPGGTQHPATAVGVDGARQHLIEQSKEVPAAGARPAKKKPLARQARPGEESAQGKPQTNMPGTRRKAQGKPAVSATSVTPAPPVGSTSTGGLPPLPAALPYTPATAKPPTAVPGITPGADGTVMARIPNSPPVPGPGGTAPPPVTAVPQRQISPRPLHPENPISGFIMDSFGEGTKPVPAPTPPPQVQARAKSQPDPAASGAGTGVFGQLGNDVQQLGEGIKSVFQRIVPGR